MNQHDTHLLLTSLQAESDKMREEMRKQAFCAFVCVVCMIITGAVAIGAGFRSVSQMIDAEKQGGCVEMSGAACMREDSEAANG